MYNEKVFTAALVIFYLSFLCYQSITKNKWRLYNLRSNFWLTSQRPQRVSIVCWNDLSAWKSNFINVVFAFVESRQPKLIYKWRLFPHSLCHWKFYIEDGLYQFHRKTLTDLNDKEINVLLIRLQQINWIITLYNQYLAIFTGKKFCVLSILNRNVFELVTAID